MVYCLLNKTLFKSGIICVSDLLFDLNNSDSYNIISKQVRKVNFLAYMGSPRHAIPSHLKRVVTLLCQAPYH